MAKANSLPKKIASTAVWMVAIPVLVVVMALRGEKKPHVKN